MRAVTTPRLEIEVNKIQHNVQMLVERLSNRGISVTGVTKAFHGMPEVACAIMRAGAGGLGDSHVETLEAMHRARVPGSDDTYSNAHA